MLREAASFLKKYTLGKENTEKVEVSVLQLNRVIQSIEDELPKVGHWKVVSDRIVDTACICECSWCEEKVLIYKDAWRYCPSCGARMIPQENDAE